MVGLWLNVSPSSKSGKQQWNLSSRSYQSAYQSAYALFAMICMYDQRLFIHAVTFFVGAVTPTCWMQYVPVNKRGVPFVVNHVTVMPDA